MGRFVRYEDRPVFGLQVGRVTSTQGVIGGHLRRVWTLEHFQWRLNKGLKTSSSKNVSRKPKQNGLRHNSWGFVGVWGGGEEWVMSPLLKLWYFIEGWMTSGYGELISLNVCPYTCSGRNKNYLLCFIKSGFFKVSRVIAKLKNITCKMTKQVLSCSTQYNKKYQVNECPYTNEEKHWLTMPPLFSNTVTFPLQQRQSTKAKELRACLYNVRQHG